MHHDLKISTKYFARVAEGTKTFLVRPDDRGFQTGDTLTLREWDDGSINPTDTAERGYTNAEPLHFKVGFIFHFSHKEIAMSLLPDERIPEGILSEISTELFEGHALARQFSHQELNPAKEKPTRKKSQKA